jgi:hypothetical protein
MDFVTVLPNFAEREERDDIQGNTLHLARRGSPGQFALRRRGARTKMTFGGWGNPV